MTRNLKGMFFSILTAIGLLAVCSLNVKADSVSQTGFTFNIIYPDNQQSQKGYFDLKMKPGAKQTVELEVHNPDKKEITVLISLNSAKTNANGMIDYLDNSIKEDKSVVHHFEKIVTGPKKVKVKGKKTAKVKLTISMPKENYDGVILGGIILEKEETSKKERPVETTQVSNRYNYAVAMVLKETDVTLEPELSFNHISVENKVNTSRIDINFSNTVADFLNEMTVEVQISKKGSGGVLYETKKAHLRMAPNTLIDFPFEVNEALTYEAYEAHILVTAENKAWEWTEEFKVTPQKQKSVNEGLGDKKGLSWAIIVYICLFIIFLTLGIYLGIRQLSKRSRRKKKRRSR